MRDTFRFVIAVLAVWRVTHLLALEDGPFDVLARFRLSLGSGMVGKLISCFYCLSMWTALPFMWFFTGTSVERVVIWLALSGAAILLHRITGGSLDIRVGGE
jgi:hypothetical protein